MLISVLKIKRIITLPDFAVVCVVSPSREVIYGCVWTYKPTVVWIGEAKESSVPSCLLLHNLISLKICFLLQGYWPIYS